MIDKVITVTNLIHMILCLINAVFIFCDAIILQVIIEINPNNENSPFHHQAYAYFLILAWFSFDIYIKL